MKKAIPLFIAVVCITGMYQLSPYRQYQQAAVDLIYPQISDLRDMVVLQGRVVDRAPIRLYAKSTAVVSEIFVEPGQRVKAGQPLLRLEQTSVDMDLQETASVVMFQVQQALKAGDIAAAQELVNAINTPQSSVISPKHEEKVYQLYSPVDCVVMEVYPTVGETVTELLPCVLLCNPQNLMIEAEAGEDTVALLREDLLCEIAIPAFEIEMLEGSVHTVMPFAREAGLFSGNTTANTTLHISVSDPSILRPGYRAEIKVITAYKQAALLLPYEAIRQDDDGQEYIMLLREKIVVRQNIRTGSELDTHVEILEGLSAQDVLLRLPDTAEEGAFIQYDITGTDTAGT